MINCIKIIVASSLLYTSGCGFVDYEGAPEGKFRGSLFVMWVDEGGPLGDGTFVYVPNPRDPLVFARGSDSNFSEIKPQMMYTDGGSIPKAAQLFEGFSPWGYAPAYMVHDWLFVARHCNVDRMATKAEEKMNGMDFQTSADIIAEAIKTLVRQDRIKDNDVSPRIISSTVAGPISHRLWQKEGACHTSRVSKADRLAAEAGIPGSSLPENTMERVLPNGEMVPLQPGRTVAEVSF